MRAPILVTAIVSILAASANGADPPWGALVADGKLTCEELRAHPDVFRGSIDLERNSSSPVEVDYTCADSLAELPFLKHLFESTDLLLGDLASSQCAGNVASFRRRYWLFELLGWGMAPSIMHDKILGYEDLGYTTATETWAYLRQWSMRGLYENESFARFQTDLESALPPLTDYYQRRFNYGRGEAQQYAKGALTSFLSHAGGSYTDEARRNTSVFSHWGNEGEESTFLRWATPREILRSTKAAIMTGQPLSVIKAFLAHVDDANQGEETVLHVAVRREDVVRYLLSRGLSVDYPNPIGKTPLFYAIERDEYPVVQLLILHGANVNHTYKDDGEIRALGDCDYVIEHASRTPLMHAAQHSGPEVLRLLIEAGASISARDALGDTALDYAIRARNQKNIDVLKGFDNHPAGGPGAN